MAALKAKIRHLSLLVSGRKGKQGSEAVEAMNADKQEHKVNQSQNDSLQAAAVWFCQKVVTKNPSWEKKIPLSGHLFPEERYYEP